MNLAPAPSSSFNPSLTSASSASDSHDSNPYSVSAFNGPYMGVVLVVLLMTFFLMAVFSVYMRRYTLALDNNAGAGGRRQGGLDRATINGFPIVVYHRSAAKGDEAAAAAAAAAQLQEHEWSHRPDCVVCLADFQEAEKVRQLPRCEHWFHPECIDMWLFSHSTCPLCRRSLLPPPPLVAEGAAAAACITIRAAPPVAPS